MKTIDGIYSSAKVFTDTAEYYALAQIKMLCDNEAFRNCKIRVMPDTHAGIVGPIGFTSTIKDKVLPNIIGQDIGCGVLIAQIKQKRIEFQKLDTVIRENIPTGFNIREIPHRYTIGYMRAFKSKLYCRNSINTQKAELSIGTLGGGNHFIEIDKDDEGHLYISIHTGSRHLGKEVTDYYLNEGQKYLKELGISVPYELTYLEGELKDQYLHDIQLIQQYANTNRIAILSDILKYMKLDGIARYDIIHNYVDFSIYEHDPVLRKGAISAKKGEPVAIPINMKEGIILGKGLGNEDWNFSAPHGSGRLMSRKDIQSNYTVSQFKKEMKGIYCTCIDKGTLDEAPFAYRGIDELCEAIKETVEIEKILKPIYNYKASK